MSPLWRDEIAIYLAPHKVALARRGRGLRPQVASATEVLVPGGHFSDVRPTLATLAELLEEPTWQDGTARIVVADPWARYGIVGATGNRLDSDGRLAHARYVLAETFGDGLADWNVTLADGPPGRAFVACAMHGALRGLIDEALDAARLKLVSLQPQLIVAYNVWRHRLPPDDAWFVSLDEGSLSAVHIANGSWDRVHMARLSNDWGLELERLQAFSRLSRTSSGAKMYVDGPVWMRTVATHASGDLEWLSDEGDGKARELALLQRAYA